MGAYWTLLLPKLLPKAAEKLLPKQPLKTPRRRGGFLRRLLGFVVAVGTIVFLAGAGAVGFVFWKVSQDLPDYEGLAKYEPPVLTRVKTPTKAMRDFCAGQPNAAVIPLVVIGHDHPMIYDWTCKGKQPTVTKQIFTVDARGFPAELWKAIAPAH